MPRSRNSGVVWYNEGMEVDEARVYEASGIRINEALKPRAYFRNAQGKIEPHHGEYRQEDVIGLIEIPDGNVADADFDLSEEVMPKWNGVLIANGVSAGALLDAEQPLGWTDAQGKVHFHEGAERRIVVVTFGDAK